MQAWITAILVAGGSSSRMGFDKLSYSLQGKSVLYRSAEALCRHPMVSEMVVVTRAEKIEAVKKELSSLGKVTCVVAGGKERQDSVRNGLAVCPQASYIAIHDAARPFVSAEVLDTVFAKALETGAAAPAVAVKDTIKYAPDGNWVQNTPNRAELFAVQTPQVFRKSLYEQALEQTAGLAVTDDCSILEQAGIPVALTAGSYANYKITTREDIPKEDTMRIGHGYDVHRLVEGRKLILGGIEIPFEKGLLGHSDADVLTHVVMDSLLGAAAMGDIGQHFPDTDPAYQDADSVQLLREVMNLLHEAGYHPVNLDATLLCQRPKLAGYLPQIRENLAAAMGIPVGDIHVKATTEEGLGFTGSGEGIAAHCVALIEKE